MRGLEVGWEEVGGGQTGHGTPAGGGRVESRCRGVLCPLLPSFLAPEQRRLCHVYPDIHRPQGRAEGHSLHQRALSLTGERYERTEADASKAHCVLQEPRAARGKVMS